MHDGTTRTEPDVVAAAWTFSAESPDLGRERLTRGRAPLAAIAMRDRLALHDLVVDPAAAVGDRTFGAGRGRRALDDRRPEDGPDLARRLHRGRRARGQSR